MAKKIDRQKLNQLLELNKKLFLEENFANKIGLISDVVKEIINADRATLFMHDSTTESLWSVYVDGISYIEVPDNMGIVSEVFKTKKTLIVNDAQNSSKFNSNIDKGTGYVTKSILSVPILGFGNIPLGVLQLINKLDGDKKFTDDDTEVVLYIISHISAFLEQMSDVD